MIDIYKYEKEAYSLGYQYIAGTDEAGRGPMAGPLVAAAVILPMGYKLEGLNDSKKLTVKQRDQFYDIIMKDALEVKICVVSTPDVDRYNVYASSKIAMMNCISQFSLPVDYVFTDAMKLEINIPHIAIIKGDMLSASIAAASVIAKVTRDRLMDKIDEEYPMYGFKKHKGYVTKLHQEMLSKYGPCKYHRLSFSPVKKAIEIIEEKGILQKQA